MESSNQKASVNPIHAFIFSVLTLVSLWYYWNASSHLPSFAVSWDGNVRLTPDFVHRPLYRQQVIDLVQRVNTEKHAIKVVGAHHSWSGITALPTKRNVTTHLVNLDHLDQVLELNSVKGTVTVEAGIRLKDLLIYLKDRDFTLAMLGSVTEQSVAGAISTGTHGSSIHIPILAGLVDSIQVVLANGTVLSLDSEHELLPAFQVNLGCLGVILVVELKIVPLFHLYGEETPLSLGTLLANHSARAAFNEDIKIQEFAKVWWIPHTDYVQYYTFNRFSDWSPRHLDLFSKSNNQVQSFIKNVLIDSYVFSFVLHVTRYFPAAIIPHRNMLIKHAAFQPVQHVDFGYKLLPLKLSVPVHRESELSVPFDYWIDALFAMRELERELYFDFVHEWRFVPKDNIWMSPAYGRDSVLITIMNQHQPHELVFRKCLQKLTNLMKDLEARHGHLYATEEERRMVFSLRPHWAKTHYMTSTQLQSTLPMFNRFVALREEVDPNDIFMNDFLQRAFYSND